MNAICHQTADAFLHLAEPWLMNAEVENNVILGIAHAIAGGILIPDEPPYLVTAVNGGEVVACALRTPPHKLLLSRADPDAPAAIARDAFARYPKLETVSGPEPAAGDFARAWSKLTGETAQIGMRQRIYVIEALGPFPAAAAGALRRAKDSDVDIARRWAADFLREANPSEQSDPDEVVRHFHRNGNLFIWDDGGPVSMCACGGRTRSGVRISLVYTPPPMRRHGYATAATAALTQFLLANGNRYCCLYTDLANAISNDIYQRIGYRALCDINDYHLAGSPALAAESAARHR
jgi:predicted GNAT family acetyltransferase